VEDKKLSSAEPAGKGILIKELLHTDKVRKELLTYWKLRILD